MTEENERIKELEAKIRVLESQLANCRHGNFLLKKKMAQLENNNPKGKDL